MSARRIAAVAVGLALWCCPRWAAAQTTDREVQVVEIAGADVYLGIGGADGVAAGDTLVLHRADGKVLGSVRVVAVTSARALVTFAGDPFPLTRGTTVLIALPGSSSTPAGVAAAAGPSPPSTPSLHTGPSVTGRLALDMDASQATTRWLTDSWQHVNRQFATPAAALRLAVSDLPGGFRFTTDLRASYRYTSMNIIDPAEAVRVYQASLDRTFGGTLDLRLGRFYNPWETYSGYWDGALLHVGAHGLGLGAAAGFEPDLYNQGFSTDYPKYSAFLTYRSSGGPVRYDADLSFHQILPQNGLPTRTFAGLSQRFGAGRFLANADLQVDRDPTSGSWTLTTFRGRVGVSLARGLNLYMRFDRSGPWVPFDTVAVLGVRRDQAGAGISWWRPSMSLSADANAGRLAGGAMTYGGSTMISFPHTPFFGLGMMLSGGLWTGDAIQSDQAGVTFTREVGMTDVRVSYRFYRSHIATTTIVTHSGDWSFSFPLAPRTFATFGANGQWGANLRGIGLHAGLWMSF